MMEQPYSGKCHSNFVFIADSYNLTVSHRASGLSNISDSAFISPFDIISKGEKGIGAKTHIIKTTRPAHT